MTVEQLIQALNNYPPNMLVYVRGYEGGVDDVDFIEEIQVERDYYEEEWYGKHNKVYEVENINGIQITKSE